MSSPSKSNPKPLFEASCTDKPSLLHISFAGDPKASLGAELVNKDMGDPEEMFLPGYAVVGRLLPGQTVARKYGVQVGDCIVAINGQGIRRFPIDYSVEDAIVLNKEDTPEGVECDNQVVPQGGAYDVLLAKIKHIKANTSGPPLVISFERYGWDSRANAWPRFLLARDGNVPSAMQLIQDHEAWKTVTFPIDLTSQGLQKIFKDKVISIMDVGMGKGHPPTIYVNYAKLQSMQSDNWATMSDIIHSFVVFTEMILSKLSDPRNPKTNQFIDLSGVTITSGFRVDTLKAINQVFERNYPETLNKMVLYPVNSMVGLTARSLLGFVDERTQNKFILTNNLDNMCDALGWKSDMVEGAGGLREFIEKYERVDYASMLFHNAGIYGDDGEEFDITDGLAKDDNHFSKSSRGRKSRPAAEKNVIQGHLKGTGVIMDRWEEDLGDDGKKTIVYKIRVTHDLLKYLVVNGLAFVDGCSLPVVDVVTAEGWFTLKCDTFIQDKIEELTSKSVGSQVCVEVDVLGKYWENDLSKLMLRLEKLEDKVESLEKQLAATKLSQPTENGTSVSEDENSLQSEKL